MQDLISKYERELIEIDYMMEKSSHSTIYLGEGYFADNLSQPEIIQFLNRRKTFILSQLHFLNPVVEIKEPVDQYPSKVIHYQKEEPTTKKVELQEFERNMLKRMMELEEREEMDSQIEILTSDDEDFSFNHVKLDKRFKDLTINEVSVPIPRIEIEAAKAKESAVDGPAKEHSLTVELKEENPRNSDSSNSTINETDTAVKAVKSILRRSNSKSDKKVQFNEDAKPNPPVKRNTVMKQMVVERVFDDEDEDYDLAQLGREVSVEYNRKKQNLLNRNLLSKEDE
ncbi:hypothetical protein HDV01_000533 [Terramyces sp. JEL0728]|nr:hypothetical protein HDV01_000533 [Terramyces sp. JEL0728]